MVACAIFILALAAVILVPGLLHLLYNYARLNSIPGPRLATVLDIRKLYARWVFRSGDEYAYGRYLAEIHQYYGDVVRLGPGIVGLSNVMDINLALNEIYSTSQKAYPTTRTPLSQDRIGKPIEESLRDLVRTIRQHRIIDLTTTFHVFADEVLAHFSTEPGIRPPAARTQAQHRSTLFTTIEELLLCSPVSLLKRDRLSCSRPTSTSLPWRDRTDVLLAQDTNGIRDVLQDSMQTASIEILKATVTSVIPLLLQSPHTLSTLCREINTTLRFHDREYIPSTQEIVGMPYLDAVFKEVMRMILLHYPIQEIQTGPKSIYISSYHIPPGTTLSYHPYILLTNPLLFGHDTDAFRPERWLTIGETKRSMMDEYLLPLSSSLYRYPAPNNVLIVSKKVIAVLLKEFDHVGTPTFMFFGIE
ncbi:cytochrome P450 [Aspergillus crustosus]